MPDRPRILYVVHRVPFPPDKGDRIRTFHLLEFLSRRAIVDVACLADEPVAPGTLGALQRYCQRLVVVNVGRTSRWMRATASLLRGRTVSEGAFYSKTMARTLTEWSREADYDCVLASSSSVAPYLRLGAFRDVPAIVDLIDVDSQKWFEYASDSFGPKAWLYRQEGHRLRRLEQSIASWARAITLVSQAEVDLLRSFCGHGAVHAIPNGVNLEYFSQTSRFGRPVGLTAPRAPDRSRRSCVFVGALDYRPNVDAVCWFSERVWPWLRALRPEARFYVVGRNPVAAVRSCQTVPGVEVVGPVDDVRPYLAGSSVAVAPLHIARGIQNKVLEAMAMARAVVVSPQALTGIDAQPGIHLLTANTPQQWIDTIWWLWTDTSLADEFGKSARRFVEEHHHWNRCLDPFDRLLGLTKDYDSCSAESAAVAS